MQSESSSSKQLKLKKCLEDIESKNNLLGFFETLLDIARANPEIIQESQPGNNGAIAIKPDKDND